MLPLNSLIIIDYEEPTEKKTEGGLYVPPATNTINAKNFLREAKVVAVNPKCEHIKAGDSVYFDIRAIYLVPGEEHKYFVRTEDTYGVK